MLNTRQILLRPILSLFLLPAILLSNGCGGGNSSESGVTNQNLVIETPRIAALSGTAVKGPLAFAEVRLYALNILTENFYDPSRAVSIGTTNASAKFTDVQLPQTTDFPLVLVIDGSNALDLTTGQAPVITTLINVVTADMIESGRGVYATPLTTLAFRLAQRIPGAHASKEAFLNALENAADTIQDKLGFGMDPNIDILRDPPLLTNNTTLPQQQQQVLEHRAALETITAIANLVTRDSSSDNGNITADNTLELFAADLANDGVLNGHAADGSLGYSNTLSSIVELSALVLPNTSLRIADIKNIVETEVEFTGTTTTLDSDHVHVKLPPVSFTNGDGLTTTILTITSSTFTTTQSSTTTTRTSTTTTRGSTSTTTSSSSTTTTTKSTISSTTTTTTTALTTTSSTSSTTKLPTTTTTRTSTTTTRGSTSTTASSSSTTTHTSSTTTSTTTKSTVSSTTTTTAASTTPTTPSVKVDKNDDPIDWTNAIALAKGTVYRISTASEFNARAASARPGDVIIVRNGNYSSWNLTIPSHGTAEARIIYTTESQKGVKFSGGTSIRVTGSFNLIGGFVFNEVTTNNSVFFERASDNRFAHNEFINCGSTEKGHILMVRNQSDRNRFDHNRLQGTKSMGMGIALPRDGDTTFAYSHDNRFDHNIFRDVAKPADPRGRMSLQVGQYATYHTTDDSRTVIDHNEFINLGSTGIQSKGNGDILVDNIFIDLPNATGLAMRSGNNKVALRNYFSNVKVGIFAYGTNHIIANNIIIDSTDVGIQIPAWGQIDGKGSGPTGNIVVAHNTVYGFKKSGIEFGRPWGSGDSKLDNPPFNLRIANNIVVGNVGTLIDRRSATEETIEYNLLHATGSARLGVAGAASILANPDLDASWNPRASSKAIGNAIRLDKIDTDYYNLTRGTSPDIGAIERR